MVKYFRKFGKILVRPKKKKGPHSTSGKKFGKILKIRKNTLENSEKYFQKFGKILQKIRKNTFENSEKYFQKSGSRTQNHFFQLWLYVNFMLPKGPFNYTNLNT